MGTVILLGGTELGVRHYLSAIRPVSESVIVYRKQQLESPRPHRYDGLILGDSRVLGVDAKVISETLSASWGKDVTFYNFAAPVHGQQSYYLFLKRYLRRHLKPQVILFTMRPIDISRMPEPTGRERGTSSIHHWLAILYPISECWETFSWKARWKSLWVRLERQSALLTYRSNIYNRLEDPWKIDNILNQIKVVAASHNGGIIYSSSLRQINDEDIKESLYYKTSFELDPQKLYWYKQFIGLAEQHGIRVILFNPPSLQKIFEHHQQDGSNQRYEMVLEGLAKEFSNITILKPLAEGKDIRFFDTPQHLNIKGFYFYSRQLSRQLAALPESLVFAAF